MQHVLENPFVPYWNQYTGRTILVFLLIYIFADMMYLAGRRNYLPGKEMGSAQFADVKKVNKCLADLSTSPDDSGNITVLGEKRKKQIKVVNTRNRILSQNIKMTLNTRHTDLNNNILVIGGSGSGKTYRFVKPQLLQMSSSFIITDPKGELYRDTSSFLKQNGYDKPDFQYDAEGGDKQRPVLGKSRRNVAASAFLLCMAGRRAGKTLGVQDTCRRR